MPGRVRVAVRLRPRNAEESIADADFSDCVELQPEVKTKNCQSHFGNLDSGWLLVFTLIVLYIFFYLSLRGLNLGRTIGIQTHMSLTRCLPNLLRKSVSMKLLLSLL